MFIFLFFFDISFLFSETTEFVCCMCAAAAAAYAPHQMRPYASLYVPRIFASRFCSQAVMVKNISKFRVSIMNNLPGWNLLKYKYYVMNIVSNVAFLALRAVYSQCKHLYDVPRIAIV